MKNKYNLRHDTRLSTVIRENRLLRAELETFKSESQRKLKALENKLAKERREREYYFFKNLQPDQYESALSDWFYEKTGKKLDLTDPKTYNEKLQWLKLYDSTQQKADLTDKYKVRDYVREKIGEKYLIPLLGVWDGPDDIRFDELPNQFVLKANHGCAYNIIVRDKAQMNEKAARNQIKKWLGENYAFHSLEMHYSLIERKIIAEEYIENIGGDVFDYKVFCFGGKAKYIMFLSERKKKLKMAFYDLEWNRMPFTYSFEPLDHDIPKPDNLAELIQAAEALAEGFPHVRVDFYILNNGEIKFGEMTFTTCSGACKWEPSEYDRILGDLISLSKH